MEGAAEAGEAERGAGLGEGREGGGVAAEALREEGGVAAEAVGVGTPRGGELDQAVPVAQGGRRRRGGVAHAGMAGRSCVFLCVCVYGLSSISFGRREEECNGLRERFL